MNGNKIKEIREAKGIGLNETARRAGISGSYLSNIERNIKGNPSMETLQRIADALGVSVADFFDNDNSENKDEDENLPDLEDEDTAEMKILFDKAVDKKLPPADKRRLMAIIKVFLEETSD